MTQNPICVVVLIRIAPLIRSQQPAFLTICGSSDTFWWCHFAFICIRRLTSSPAMNECYPSIVMNKSSRVLCVCVVYVLVLSIMSLFELLASKSYHLPSIYSMSPSLVLMAAKITPCLLEIPFERPAKNSNPLASVFPNEEICTG